MVSRLARLHIDVIQNARDTLFFRVHLVPVLVSSRHRRLRSRTTAVSRVDGPGLLCVVRCVHHGRGDVQVLCREVGLQLLEQDQDQSHFILLGQLLEGRLLQLLHVQVKVFIWLEDVRGFREHVVEELSEEECRALVLLLGLIELVLDSLVLRQKSIVFLLLHY